VFDDDAIGAHVLCVSAVRAILDDVVVMLVWVRGALAMLLDDGVLAATTCVHKRNNMIKRMHVITVLDIR
jgi:hypothetical protein